MADMPAMKPVDLHGSGLLWLINRQVFHPRGYALAVDPDSKACYLMGDGSKPWEYLTQQADPDNPGAIDEEAHLAQIKALMP